MPGAGRSGQQKAASCGAVVLPVGATEQDVFERLGAPLTRRPVSEDSETWSYESGSDTGFSASAILTFQHGRLVDAVEYIFK